MSALGDLFTNIATAIRNKTGETATMKPAEFPDKIASITTGGGGSTSGTGWHHYSGEFTTTSKIHTITHNIGHIPDIFYVYKMASLPLVTSYRSLYYFGISARIYNQLGENSKSKGPISMMATYNETNQEIWFLNATASNIESSESYFGALRDCTTTTITVGIDVENAGLVVDDDYSWGALWYDGTF